MDLGRGSKIDMTPPNKLDETLKQVTKILKSPGCRLVLSLSVTIERDTKIIAQ